MIFPYLEIEEKVQVNDKTRFSGIKSFASKGEAAFTTATITPGTSGTPISVFNADQKLWFTDWLWTSWAFEVDANSAKIDFTESSTSFVATIATAVYTSISSLASAMQTALNAAGGAGVWTVSVDSQERITFASTASFSLKGATGDNRLIGMLQHLGIMIDTESASSFTTKPMQYGLRKVTLTINNGTGAVSSISYQKVYSEQGDRLFCADSDLTAYESDILKWVPPGRASFKDVYRKVQENIMDWIEGEGYRGLYDEKLTKFDIKDTQQIREFAMYKALVMIFEGNSNAVDDIFDKKAKYYASKEVKARNRFIGIDLDADGIVNNDEVLSNQSGSLFLR